MELVRGTKDILPSEIQIWQNIYKTVLETLTRYNYYEIRTPIIENSSLFIRSIGNETDIVNKEMYSFIDQGKRQLTLRPEGTASIARAFISNKLDQKNSINRLWYLGPMFRYERPQSGRQRQFHQLGIECIGSYHPMADVEVINIAHQLLIKLGCNQHLLEINSIGNQEERQIYQEDLIKYLENYKKDLDIDSRKRLHTNPLRILDSKILKTQEILRNAPCLNKYLQYESEKHFAMVCEYLKTINISFTINDKLVRGLDYYNNTAFEIKAKELNSQNTICGGGRYDKLIKSLGGPQTPSVGWAIGLERLISIIKKETEKKNYRNLFYIAAQGLNAQKKIWPLANLLETNKINFSVDLDNSNFQKQLRKANKIGSIGCLIIGEEEVRNSTITIKWLIDRSQETVSYSTIVKVLLYGIKKHTSSTLDNI